MGRAVAADRGAPRSPRRRLLHQGVPRPAGRAAPCPLGMGRAALRAPVPHVPATYARGVAVYRDRPKEGANSGPHRRGATPARRSDEPRVAALGAVPERAPVGHRPGGLQRGRRRLGLLHPRRRPGRGPTAGARTAWPGSATTSSGCASRIALWNEQDADPQGAAVRPHQLRGQPRRGREGVLLLPGQRAHALLPAVAVQVPAGGVPVRGPGADEPLTVPPGAGVRAARHRRVRRGSLLRRPGRVRQGRPRRPGLPHHRRTTGARTTRRLHLLPDAVVPQHLVLAAARPEPAARAGSRPSSPTVLRGAPELGACYPARRAPTELLFCENETQHRTGCGAAENSTPYPKDGINDHVVHGGRRREPRTATGTKAAAHVARSSCRPVGEAVVLRASRPARRPTARPRPVRRRRRADRRDAPRARPTSSTTRSRRAGVERRRRRRSCARRWPGCCGRSSATTSTSTCWLREHDAHPLRSPPRRGTAQRVVVPHGQPRRHLDARQVGVPVVRGVGPGLPHASPLGDGRPRLRQGPARR